MNKNTIRLVLIFLLSAILTAAPSGCVIFGSKTIYEDPEHVDFSEGEAQGGAETTSEEQVEFTETYFKQDGIWLFYDSQLVLDVQPFSETIPATFDDGPNMVSYPDIIHFDLAMEQAHIFIAEVNAYKQAAGFASETFQLLTNLISDPEKLSGCVPELPMDVFYRICDHQQFTANLKKVDFGNGSGVRFTTVHGIHDFAPVDNENLVYVFQGFTDYGNLFVKMYVDLLHAQLPDQGEIPPEVYSGDVEAMESYFNDIENMLNTSEDDFSPKLDWVDNFLASLRVEQPG